MLEDSEDLAEEVLRRLGYLDPGEVHNSDFREAASAFCQCLHTNRYMLRKSLEGTAPVKIHVNTVSVLMCFACADVVMACGSLASNYLEMLFF